MRPVQSQNLRLFLRCVAKVLAPIVPVSDMRLGGGYARRCCAVP